MSIIRLLLVFLFCFSTILHAQQAAPVITSLTITNSKKTITWDPLPGVKQYKLYSSTNFTGPYNQVNAGTFHELKLDRDGYEFNRHVFSGGLSADSR